MKQLTTIFRIFLPTLLLMLFVKPVNAQVPVTAWAKRIGGTGIDQSNSMVIDASGNSYIAGTFSGTADFDPSAATAALTSVGITNMFFAKYDPNGNYIWAKCITGGSGLISIAVDASQNVYIAGGISNGATYDFDPSSAVVNLTASGTQDIYVAKYTSTGAYSWVKKMGGSDLEYARAIDVDASGNVYTTGLYRATVDFDPGSGVFNLTDNNTGSAFDGFVSKLTTNGDFVWAKGFGGTYFDSPYGIKVDATNVYVTGQFGETVDFDPGTGVYNLTVAEPGGSDQDAFLLKLTLAGNFVWARNIAGGNNAELGESIAVDASGNVYTAGWFGGSNTDFDPGIGSVQLTSLNGIKSFVSKLDVNGDFVWANKITATNGDPVFGRNVVLDAAGNCYLSSYFNTDANVVISSVTTNFVTNGDYDVLITKLSPAGNFLWGKKIGGTGYEQPFSIRMNTGGELLATGIFSNTMTVDAFGLTSAGNSDVFFIKLAPSVCTSSTSTIIASHCSTYTVPSGHETYTVSGTYMDTIPNAAGCDSIITINLTISDGIAPVANLASLANITSQCSVTSLTAPTATDNCAGTITGTHNASLPITTSGTTVVTWTYNDGHGNTATQTQNVIITDNLAPVANAANLSDITNQCSVTSLTAPTATDNCAGTITGTHNASLPITTSGTTVITWTYNDGHGNTSTQTQNVIITDNNAPVANLANLPAVTGSCSVTTLTAPTATDNCAGTITGIHNAALPITAPGTTIVTWTYNDGHGNTSTQTQNVVISVPVVTTTLSGITISATTSGATYQWINCGTGNTPIAGATAQSFTATANGTYAVIVTQNGCSATSACVTISTVGLEEMDQTVFVVYPNPNNGTFTVVTEFEGTIEIRNTAGQEVSTKQLMSGENNIELEGVESGMYFISITDPNGRVFVQRVSVIK